MALRILEWHHAWQERAEDAIGPAQGKGHLERCAGGNGSLPTLQHAGQGLRIVDALPAPALHLFGGGAGVFIPPPVVPRDIPVAIGPPSEEIGRASWRGR